MEHEDGFCDECGAEIVGEVWLTFDGYERCRDCAIETGKVAVAKHPEARDDGQ